ncbi:MAG: hypothetical protein ABI170_01835 [Microbacteriaceae bacterium]
MPSFRVTMSVGALLPGTDPAGLLPVAADAARELTTVEAADIRLVRGAAQLVVRFTAADDADAARIARHTRTVTGGAAQLSTCSVTRRAGGRWNPL